MSHVDTASVGTTTIPTVIGGTSTLLVQTTQASSNQSSNPATATPTSTSTFTPPSRPSSSSPLPSTSLTASSVLSSIPISGATNPTMNSSGGDSASPNSSSTNSTSPRLSSTNSSKNSIAPGAAVGIGVGSAIAGALIAALILWFFMRRKARKSRNASVHDPAYRLLPDKSSGAATVDSSLPQPLGDKEIRSEFSTLCTVIKNHVISYYPTSPPRTEIDNVNEAALELLGPYAPVIASTLTALLSDPETRIAALRFCIAWIVISRIGPECEPHLTLLPPDIARCMGSMSGSSNGQPNLNHAALLSKWRAISAFLLQDTYGGQRALSRTDPRHPNIEAALSALDKVLCPYADQSRGNSQRSKNLKEILKRGARVGFLLFSQPAGWKFDWDGPGGEVKADGRLTVFPALIKVGDDSNGPRVLVDKEAM